MNITDDLFFCVFCFCFSLKKKLQKPWFQIFVGTSCYLCYFLHLISVAVGSCFWFLYISYNDAGWGSCYFLKINLLFFFFDLELELL